MLIGPLGIFLCVLIFIFFGGKISSEMKDCKQSFSKERLICTRKKSPPGGFSTAEDNMGLRSQPCLAPSATNHSYCLNCSLAQFWSKQLIPEAGKLRHWKEKMEKTGSDREEVQIQPLQLNVSLI